VETCDARYRIPPGLFVISEGPRGPRADSRREGVLQQTVGSHTWEIDVFHGDNDGLIVAEVEVSSETEAFVRPSWVAEEVSGDPRYFNNNLIMNPFKAWGTTRAKTAKRIKPPRRVAKTAGAKKSSFKHASKRKSPRRRRECAS